MSKNCRRMTGNNRTKRRPDHSLSIKASLVLCLLVLFFAGLNSMSVKAGSNPGAEVQTEQKITKIYTTYKIRKGDTLQSIAKENCDLTHYDTYEDYIIEVQDINHLLGGNLYAGNYITIPVYI